MVLLAHRRARLLDRTGRQVWDVPVADGAVAAHAGADVVSIGGARGGVTALSTTDGGVLWQVATPPVATLHATAGRRPRGHRRWA